MGSPYTSYNPFVNANPITTTSVMYYKNDDISVIVKNKLRKSILKYLNKSTELFCGGYIWFDFTFHSEHESITLLKIWLKDRGLLLSDNDNIWLIKLLIKKMKADNNIFSALYYYGYGRRWFNYFLNKKYAQNIIKYGKPLGVDKSSNFCVYQLGAKIFWLNRNLTKIKHIKNNENIDEKTFRNLCWK